MRSWRSSLGESFFAPLDPSGDHLLWRYDLTAALVSSLYRGPGQLGLRHRSGPGERKDLPRRRLHDCRGEPRPYLAAVDLATGNLLPWSIPADGPVHTLAVSTNGLFVGGDFTMLAGTTRNGLGLVDPLSNVVLGWDAACGGNVRAIEAAGAAVYVGGYFSIIHSVPRSNLAAIDEISGAALSWAPSTNATVEELMASGSTVYVGGQFSTVNGITRNRAAAVDAVTGTPTFAFNPNVDTFGFTTVRTFAISGSTGTWADSSRPFVERSGSALRR